MEKERSLDERESDLEQRERHDAEKAEYRKERQKRLGHVEVDEEKSTSKAKSKPKADKKPE